MTKLHALILAAGMAFASQAGAQSGIIIGPDGGYQGSYSTHGNTTTFNGPSGGYGGSATTFGNSTRFTGPSGGYRGSANTFGNTTTFTGPNGGYLGSTTSPQQPLLVPFGRWKY